MHICRVLLPNYGNVSFILNLYILAVKPNKANKVVFSGTAVDLSCNSNALITFQKDLAQFWYKDGKLKKKSKLDESLMSSHLFIPKVDGSDKGVYECHVKDIRRNLTYVTNIISVHVKTVIAFVYNPYFWLYLSSGLVFICIVSCSYVYIKYREIYADEMGYKALTDDEANTENESQNESQN